MPPAGRNLKARWQGLWPAAWGFDKLSLSGGDRRGIEGRWSAGWGFDGLSLSGGEGRGIEGRRICMEWNRQIMSLPAGGIFG